MSPRPIYVSYAIDGTLSYHRHAYSKEVKIHGDIDGDVLRPYTFVATPVSSDSSSSSPQLGTIHVEVYATVDVEPFEVNVDKEVPVTRKFTPKTSVKSESLGTDLAEPQTIHLAKQIIKYACGDTIVASLTFTARSPFAMLAANLMGRCWTDWWNNEKQIFSMFYSFLFFTERSTRFG